MKKRELRSGYTTGACAAAAAKAATMLLLSAIVRQCDSATETDITSELPSFRAKDVEIPFPDGSRVKFKIQSSKFKIEDSKLIACASVIKDAGDDPDVTNGAEISATVRLIEQQSSKVAEQQLKEINPTGLLRYCSTALIIKGGEGVGIVTKPGLAVSVGEHAINPVPKKMIKEAVMEAIEDSNELIVTSNKKEDDSKNSLLVTRYSLPCLEITISVPDGERLAKKTLNQRLGIIGGISILGTTGIVKPISSEAWTATITSSMDVAEAMGNRELILSAGRASEKAHIKKYSFPEEACVMMGDYLEFSLLEAKRHSFKKIHLCAQWAKMLKIAMATPQTHVRHGAIDLKKAVEFLENLGQGARGKGQGWDNEFNTAREIFDFINSKLLTHNSKLLKEVCSAAKNYAEGITSGAPVVTHLVSYDGEIIADSN